MIGTATMVMPTFQEVIDNALYRAFVSGDTVKINFSDLHLSRDRIKRAYEIEEITTRYEEDGWKVSVLSDGITFSKKSFWPWQNPG